MCARTAATTFTKKTSRVSTSFRLRKRASTPGCKLHYLAQDLAMIQSMGVKIVLVHGFRPQVNDVLDRTHLRFFTRKSMLREFAAAGFEIQSIEGINACWLSWKFRLLRALMPTLMSDMPYQQFGLRAVKPMTI